MVTIAHSDTSLRHLDGGRTLELLLQIGDGEGGDIRTSGDDFGRGGAGENRLMASRQSWRHAVTETVAAPS